MTTLPRDHIVLPEGASPTLTVGQIRRITDTLPDTAVVLIDGRDARLATDYAGVLYIDTGRGLPTPCPVCGGQGCGCHE